MTRKDYELIAEAIREVRSDYLELDELLDDPEITVEKVLSDFIDELADRLSDENPRFNRSIFINACWGK